MTLARPLARLAVATLAALASLAGAEGVARWRWPAEAQALEAGTLDARTLGCAHRHPTRGWAIAGKCGRDADGIFTRAPAPPGALRLLVVGDSVAEGPWTQALADALGRIGGRPVDLLDAATSGWNTCQEAVALRELIDAQRPDAVLLQTCSNDYLGSAVVVPDGAWSSVAWDGGWRRVPTLALRSRLVQIALVSRSRPSAQGELGRQLVACARDADAAMREAGVPAVVLHFPALVDDEEADARAVALRDEEARMRGAFARLGVAQVDGRAALRPLGSLAALATTEDDRIHPSKRVAAAIGEALAPPVATALGLDGSR